MNKIYLLAISAALSGTLMAQAPEQMTYQGVVRNASDQLLANQQLGMQFSILQGSISGNPVYVETAMPTTNANGLVTYEIGTGTVVSGDFSMIDWGNGPYFIKTETDPQGGTNYTISGISPLLSVPYALHSKTAESISGTYNETDPVYGASPAAGITNGDITNWNNKLDAELDGDPTNEIELPMGGTNGQVLQTDGSGNYIWVDQTVNTDTQLDEAAVDAFVVNNGYITNPNDADSDPNNEIELPNGGSNGQVLQTNGSGVYTWVNQTVNTNTQLTESEVDAFVANNGYVTSAIDADADPTNEIELPNGGNNGDILQTDGAGNYTWIAPAGGVENDPVYGASPASGITNGDITNWNNKLDAELDGDPTNEIELPNGGNNGDMLVTDGSGNYSWTAPAGGGSSGNDFYLGQDTLGGIVFYIYEDVNGNQHGLLVSKGQGFNHQWQSSVSNLAGQNSYDGEVNTSFMTPATSPVINNYIAPMGTGWYLPSLDELNLLYQNRRWANQGLAASGSATIPYNNASNLYHLSSSQFNINNAMVVDFATGQTTNRSKTLALMYARGVKAF